MRLLFLVFLTGPNGFRPVILNAHDGALKLVLPLAILGFPTIFLGYLAKDMIIGFGTGFWKLRTQSTPFQVISHSGPELSVHFLLRFIRCAYYFWFF
jgi:NADH-ubiquinone oxidoreductase chain 5